MPLSIITNLNALHRSINWLAQALS
jgi:hypothetical protein